jgi:uncharacterized ParB-like nuclease family protein
MESIEAYIAAVNAQNRMRSLSEVQVSALIASIADVGLLNPITVYRNPDSHHTFGLVAGAHRLEACRRLGWETIPVNVVELGDLQRQIAECDENLCGTRLTPSERATFIKRRKEAYEALYPETRRGAVGRGGKKSPQLEDYSAPKSFTEDTSEKTGQSRQTVERDAARGLKISEQALAALRGTHLDKGVYLDRLKALPEAAQVAVVERDLAKGGANLRAAVGTASATAEERGLNFYETPAEATHALLVLERFEDQIWEPACGKGAISRVLEAAGYDVHLSDIEDRGCADQHGLLQGVADFMTTRRTISDDGVLNLDIEGRPDIVTNPPYGPELNAFVAHALREHQPRKMALLLNLNFICGFNDPDRNFVMDDMRPARIHVFTRRLPMMHRDGWTGAEASSRMNTAWFVWEQPHERSARETVINRVDWQQLQDQKPKLPRRLELAAEQAKVTKRRSKKEPADA